MCLVGFVEVGGEGLLMLGTLGGFVDSDCLLAPRLSLTALFVVRVCTGPLVAVRGYGSRGEVLDKGMAGGDGVAWTLEAVFGLAGGATVVRGFVTVSLVDTLEELGAVGDTLARREVL